MSDWRNDDFRKDLERRLGRFEEDGTARPGAPGDGDESIDPYDPGDQPPTDGDGFGYSSDYDDPPPARRRVKPLRVILLIVLLLALGGVGGFVWHAYTTSQMLVATDDVPVVRAADGPPRVRPDQPGGLEVPHQDRLVLRDLDPATAPLQAERLLPPPEEPIPRAPAETETEGETAEAGSDQWPPPPPGGADGLTQPPQTAEVPAAVAGLRPDAARPQAGAPQVEALIPRGTEPPEPPRAAPVPEPPPSSGAPPPPEPVPGLSVTFQLDRGGLRPVEPMGTANAPTPPTPPAQTDAEPLSDEALESAADLPPPEPPPGAASAPEPQTAEAPAPAPQPAEPEPAPAAEEPEIVATPVADGEHPPLPGRRPALPEAAPAQNAPAQVAAAPDPATPPAAAAPPPPTIVESDGPVTGFRIQLSSVRSEAQARDEWQRFRTRHPDLLGPLTLAVQQVELSGRGTFFRVQAGTAAGLSQAEVQRLCGQLQAQNTDCLLVRP